MSGVQRDYGYQYKTVAASVTTQILGTTGKAGDYLHRLIITVNAMLTSAVTLTDGATVIALVPLNVASGIGVLNFEIGAASLTTGWKITTAAGVTVVAVGLFT